MRQVHEGRITLDPFEPDHVGPNSVDLRLDRVLATYRDSILDVRADNPTDRWTIGDEGFVLQPGVLYLASTIERAGSRFYAPMLEGRSSLARLGLQVHMTAGFGDLGFEGTWTLEIMTHCAIRVYPMMRIAQVYFHEVVGERRFYGGKYKAQEGPTPSRSWCDPEFG